MQYLGNSAIISDDGRYRYLLRRVWDDRKPTATLIMLNPSTADALKDDPTIRSCVRLLNFLEYGGMEVVNLFAWRATKPKDLPTKPSLAIGSENPRTIEAAVARCSTVICAWGTHPYAMQNAKGVLDIVSLYKQVAYCFGRTKSGHPKHPLYIKTGTDLMAYKRFRDSCQPHN